MKVWLTLLIVCITLAGIGSAGIAQADSPSGSCDPPPDKPKNPPKK
ncbi:MAG: hypothetical protein ACAF41_02030 [Leptolyngbya sp. BL-A-14]